MFIVFTIVINFQMTNFAFNYLQDGQWCKELHNYTHTSIEVYHVNASTQPKYCGWSCT